MTKNQKIAIVSAGLVILGLYYFYKQSKQPQSIKENPDSTTEKADWNKVLKKGSKGVEVGILQRALKQLKDDEDFGDLTEARLKKVMNVTETSLNNYNKFINKK